MDKILRSYGTHALPMWNSDNELIQNNIPENEKWLEHLLHIFTASATDRPSSVLFGDSAILNKRQIEPGDFFANFKEILFERDSSFECDNIARGK